MKYTAVMIIALTLLSSCNKPISSRDYADRFIVAESRAWSTGDLADLKNLEADDVTFHLPGTELKGWKAHEEFITNGRQTVTSLKQDWKYLSGDAEYILLDYSSSAVLKGDEKNPPLATSNNYLFVLRLREEKIAEIWANGSQTSNALKP